MDRIFLGILLCVCVVITVGLWIIGSSISSLTNTQLSESTPIETQVISRNNGVEKKPLVEAHEIIIPSNEPSDEITLSGSDIYAINCAGCHGDEGAGDGSVAKHFNPRPLNFTSGLFAFRSTGYSGMPSDEDLLRTISDGIRWSAMPPFENILSLKERKAVLIHLKTLSKFYDEDDNEWYNLFELRGEPDSVGVPSAPEPNAKLIALGKRLYVANCFQCHGINGFGDGPLSTMQKDAWDRPIHPANLSQYIYKRGSEVGEIFMRIRTGLPGTPMPATDKSMMTDKEVWAIAFYVKSMQQDPPDQIERGKLNYRAFGCIQCHGSEAVGGINNPNYAKGSIPALNTLAEKMFLEYEEDVDIVVEVLMENETLGEDERLEEIERYQVVLAQYDSIREIIRNGNHAAAIDPDGSLPAIPFMPAFRDVMSEKDISAIISYLLTLQPWEDWEDEDTDDLTVAQSSTSP